MSFGVKVLSLICLVVVIAQPSEQGWFDGESWYSQFPGYYYRNEYAAINDFLTKQVDASEPMEANMDALVAKLAANKNTRREKRVLIKLTGLKNTEGRCDKVSYDILQDNDEATLFKARSVGTETANAPLRIEQLINHYGQKHAQICQKETEASIHQKLASGDQKVQQDVAVWLDPVIESILAAYKPDDGEQVAQDTASQLYFGVIARKGDTQDPAMFNLETAYNAIKTLVKDQPDDEKYLHYVADEKTGKRSFSERKFNELFKKYLEKTCTAYNDNLGDLLERATYDAIFDHTVNPDEIQVYKAWAYGEICDDIFAKPMKYEGLEFFPTHELTQYAKKIADEEESTKNVA